MGGKERETDHEGLLDLAESLATTFIQRRDLYAKQLEDGSYVSIKRGLQPKHLEDHLQGAITLGAYLLDEESKGRFLIYDADNQPDWRRLQALSGVLSESGSASYLESSRRGGHLWMFFDEPLVGKDIRLFGQGLLEHFKIDRVELFPKQDKLTSGPGSLIRLPFGVHQLTGRRYSFYTPDGQPLAPTLSEQIHALRAPETVPKAVLEQFRDYAPELAGSTPQDLSGEPQSVRNMVDTDAPLSERIKTAMPARQFLLRYVELSPNGKAICPFHNDTAASLSVNDEGNYWNCFGCDKGGSIIDFWMARQECDFKTAVSELADMLL